MLKSRNDDVFGKTGECGESLNRGLPGSVVHIFRSLPSVCCAAHWNGKAQKMRQIKPVSNFSVGTQTAEYLGFQSDFPANIKEFS